MLDHRGASTGPSQPWREAAIAAGYSGASVVAGGAVTFIALVVGVWAGGTARDNGVADSETVDTVTGVVALAAFLVAAYVLGRYARRDLEVWSFGLGSLIGMIGLGLAEANATEDVGIGLVVVTAATVSLTALVANFAGYSMASYGEGIRRGRQPQRGRPFEPGDMTGRHATIEQALERIARSGGRTVVGDLDHWGSADPPLPTEVLILAEASRLCGRVTARADQQDDLLGLGWHPDTGTVRPRERATLVYFERAWDFPETNAPEIAAELREVLRLAGPVRRDALVPLELELKDRVSGVVEPEAAGYGSLVLGPFLVIVIAIVLGIATVVLGERAVDPLLLGIGVAMLAVLLVSSLGRWLLPRLPRLGRHADGLWWASLLLLPPLVAIGSFVAELVAQD